MQSAIRKVIKMKSIPSMDEWLKEAKASKNADKCGMYLAHNGVVRSTPKAVARSLAGNEKLMDSQVVSMNFSYDKEKVEAAINETYKLPGIFYIKTWLNEGILQVGDDIMYVMIGGDIRPNVVDALNFLVGKIKDTCVVEEESF